MSLVTISGHLFVLALLLMPLRGRQRYRRLLRDLEAGVPDARLRFYRYSMVRTAIMGAVVGGWLAFVPGRYPFEFAWATPGRTLSWIAYAFVLVAASTLFYRRRGDWQIRFLVRMAGGLLPAGRRETRLFRAFCFFAGTGEEVIFRWFLMSYCTAILGLGLWESVALSSVIFGSAHFYQGALGVVMTGLLGAVLAAIWLQAGSLWVPIAMHILIDLRVSFIATPERLARLRDA